MIPKNPLKIKTWLLLLGLTFSIIGSADRLNVAVASNFVPTLQQLATAFKAAYGHEIIISSGSTGQLYAQIKQGAPFDVYMAADTKRPQLLIDDNLASGYQVYATGQLVLLSNRLEPEQTPNTSCQKVLSGADLTYLAIANPDLAPYGLAAKQYLQHFAIWDLVQPKLVMGENITQAMQMVATGNATAGLIAQSLMVNYILKENQCSWPIPPEFHEPIAQAMVLLNSSKQSKLFNQFRTFLNSAVARKIIVNNGYLINSKASEA